MLLFTEGGAGTYIVRFEARDPDDLEDEARAVFWFNQAFTIAQVALLLAAIPLAQRVFHEPAIAGPLLVLGAAFLVRQLSVVPEALARRNFAYRGLVARDLVTNVVSSAITVVMALRGFGVYSIVLPNLLIEPVRLLLLLRLTRFNPGWQLRVAQWRSIYNFTKHLIGTEVIFLVLNDSDTLLIGAVLGPEAVGLYSLAWLLASLVGRNVVSVVTDVATPTMAEAHRRGDLTAVYTKSLQILGTLTLPPQLLLAACAPIVIAVLYGPGYEGAVPVLIVLAIFMAVRGVTSMTGPVFSVLGTPRTGFLLSLATMPPYLAGIVLGAHFGVVGVALAVAGVRIVGGLWGLGLSIARLDGGGWTIVSASARSLPGALAGAAAAWLTQSALAQLEPVTRLGAAGLVGMLVSLIVEVTTNRAGIDEARSALLGRALK